MKWDEERTEELAKLYRTMTADELALHFKTSKSSIYDKAWRLGLHKDQPSKAALTTHNKLWLMKNYPDMRNEICADYIGVSLRTLARLARRLGLYKSPQFMHECQAFTAKKARESHLRNGTYPPKGYYSPNLQKGEKYQFKPKVKQAESGKLEDTNGGDNTLQTKITQTK